MGTIPNGILGNVRGMVGTVVGSSWRGIDYIRSKGGRRNGNPTPAQEIQRAKFKLVSEFLLTMLGLLRITYREYAKKMTARNNALAYNLANAVTGEYPDLALDYSMVLVSRGSNLPNVSVASAAAGAAGVIDFSWTDNSGIGNAVATDRAILVAHVPSLKHSVYIINGPARNAGAGALQVPAFSGKQAHTWIAFLSEDGKEVSSSVYTGLVTVL